MRDVVLVGCGLIGGSIARALKRASGEIRLTIVDRGTTLEQRELAALAAHRVPLELAREERPRLEADLVVLCLPISMIVKELPNWLEPSVPVTDTGSTKRAIATAVRGLGATQDWFVPGHPMAGKSASGFLAADPDLFVDRPWILCPEGVVPEAVDAVDTLVQLVGARRVDMSVEEHDQAVAFTSHLPHLVASGLLLAATRAGATLTAGPAFADMTRVAGPSEAIWRDILATNASPIAAALEELQSRLERIRQGLAADPPDLAEALRLFSEARSLRSNRESR